MAYKISDACICCGGCEVACPVQAISMGEDHFEIDAAKCMSCGCCEATCPVGAPAMEE